MFSRKTLQLTAGYKLKKVTAHLFRRVTFVNPRLSLGATGAVLCIDITVCRKGTGSRLYFANNSKRKQNKICFQLIALKHKWAKYR